MDIITIIGGTIAFVALVVIIRKNKKLEVETRAVDLILDNAFDKIVLELFHEKGIKKENIFVVSKEFYNNEESCIFVFRVLSGEFHGYIEAGYYVDEEKTKIIYYQKEV